MPIIPVLRRYRLEDQNFKFIPGYLATLSLMTKKSLSTKHKKKSPLDQKFDSWPTALFCNSFGLMLIKYYRLSSWFHLWNR